MLKLLRFKVTSRFILSGIILLALFLRIYGINWDQNQHLHPDERFLTMVTQDLKWVPNFPDYLNSKTSTLNPNNVGYGFFVYGTLPLVLVKLFSPILQINNFEYNNITLVGRFVSAIFDLGTLFIVYKIARKIFSGITATIAAFLYAISVLPIQLSHFFAVDTFLVFFITMSFYFLINIFEGKKTTTFSILSGISLGLALACKISATLFFPIVALGFLFYLVKFKNLKQTILYFLYTVLFAFLSFRIADPHVFYGYNIFIPKISPSFVANLKQLKSFDNPQSLFPPGIQWLTTKPLVFPLKNILLWGLGLPLGILSVTAIFYELLRIIKVQLKKSGSGKLKNIIDNIIVKERNSILVLSWITLLFIYEGAQYAKTMRYFYPIYPFLVILSAGFLYRCINSLKQKVRNRSLLLLFYSSTLLLLLVWPLSFISIYSRQHSRVTASEWIYQNIPINSSLSCDLWDDCLPLSLDGYGTMNEYQILTMEPFTPDTADKQTKFNEQLQKVDYLILSSNRAWGSLSKVPDKFPFMSKFYQDLFAGKLNFEKIAEISSYPTIPILNIPIPDQSSEEAFTVYDHPKVLIYKRVKSS